jgi:tetraacyldisaccharide 4'-kinase
MLPLLLAPWEKLYAAVVHARNRRFDCYPGRRLQWPVISIGNLSVGGAGKTPLVICLARLFAAAGWHPDVLSRGYGRDDRSTAQVDPNGSPAKFGDEPLLIARSAGVPVFVGASRYQAGCLAENNSSEPGLHLLDDGFQHRQLARALDIVVMHRSDLRQRLLPAGRLREPLSSLRRANVIVLRQEDGELEHALRSYTGAACQYWHIRRKLLLETKPQKAIAFCGIARPAEFFAGLEELGVTLVERVCFRDHHRFTSPDIERLARLGEQLGCDAFLTTRKDQIKLDAGMQSRLCAVARLEVVGLSVELADPDSALRYVRESLIVPES